jgi:hypothetical protein
MDFNFSDLGNYLKGISWPQALGALGTGGALVSSLYGYQRQMAEAKRQRAIEAQRAAELSALANRPLDINQYYTPLSDAAHAAAVRALQANNPNARLQGGYADALVSEGLAKTEAERYQQAADIARSARMQQLQALMGRPLPQQLPVPPVIGDFGAMGKALEYEAAQRRNQEYMQILRKALGMDPNGNPGQADTRNIMPTSPGPWRSGYVYGAMPSVYNTSPYGDVFQSPWATGGPATPAPSQYLPAYANTIRGTGYDSGSYEDPYGSQGY